MSTPLALGTPLALLLLIVPLAFAVVALRRRRVRASAFAALPRRRRGVAVGVRVALLCALVLCIAALQVQASTPAQTLVVVADRSASTASAGTAETALIAALQRGLPGGDRLGVVATGAQATVEHPPDLHPQGSDGLPVAVDPSATDLAAGLRLAGSLVAEGTRGHVVLVSDGRQTSGDAIAEAGALQAAGTRVDVVPLRIASGLDVRVDALRVPSPITAQARAHAAVDLASSAATHAVLRVDVDGSAVTQRDLGLGAGATSIDVELPQLAAGLHHVHAAIDAPQDTVLQNNVGDAVVQVLGPQRLAVVEGTAGDGANLASAARAAGLQVDVLSPAQLPADAAHLATWQAVALVDVSADQLGTSRMAAVQTAVRDLGMGLTVTGGAHTLGPGGFAGTPLEQTLPVSMDVSDPKDKQPVAVVLVLESVETSEGDGVLRAAARSVVQHLQPQDFVGVTDALHGFAVPLTQVGDGRAVAAQVDAITQFGDPPSYDPYISAAVAALHAHPEANRHIVVLGDGDADAVSPSLLSSVVAQGVTVSAVGVDIDRNPEQMGEMRDVAEAGHGRFYQSEDASQVPDVLLDQTSRELRPWIVQQAFQPTTASPADVLAGVDLAALPDLQGYVTTTAKSGATLALTGPHRDPILVEGQYGLGRAVVWTSDVGGTWSADLLRWRDGGILLANLVNNVLPLAADPELAVTTAVQGATGHVVAQLSGGAAADATAVASVVAPDGSHLDVALSRTGSGRFEADFPAAATGIYVVRVTLSAAGRVLHTSTAGLAIAYAPEYRFTGTDGGTLAAIARAGGGAVLSGAAPVLGAPLPVATTRQELTSALLVLALALLLVDVAVRRLRLRRGDLAVWRATVVGEDGQGAAAAAGVATLRSRVGVRRAVGPGTGAARASVVRPAGERSGTGGRDAGAARGGSGEPASEELARRLLEARRRR